MRKILATSLVLALLVGVATVSAHDGNKSGKKMIAAKAQDTESFQRLPLTQQKRGARQNQIFDQAIYTENFDAGAPGWTYQDLWSESAWHPSTTGAFAGKSYWAGIEALGGYDDSWTQSLTSPAIALPAGSGISLSFTHDLSVESLSGGYPAGYDSWDAVTVRLSTDGTTFNVISPSSGPAYNVTSAYGFHFYYGTGVAGWAGATGGYVSSTFDLSAFAGQTVWIRFELGSDEGFSHADDPTLFGWRVDNIQVTQGGTTVFSDDAGDTGAAQFTAGGPGGPNYWHITSVAAASAPNSAGGFDQASGNYLSNAKAALVSPAIDLTGLPNNTRQLIPDLKLQGAIDPAVGADGNQDLLNIEYRGYSGGAWSYWTNFSFIAGVPPTFAGYNASYATDMDISLLIGAADSVQFRVILYGAPDGAVVPPANLFIDDFVITAITTLANDVSVIDLDVPFPNLASFATQSGQARVANIGLNNQATVLVRYRVNDGPVTLPIPPNPLNLPAGAQASSIFGWKAPVPGNYKLTALTTLGADENRTNDTLSVAPITVFPDGIAELGYDDRFLQDQFITASTCLVNFSVLPDLQGVTDTYDLRQVKVDLLNASATDADQLRIVVATASDDTTLVDVLLDVVETLPPGDFSSHYFDVNAFGLTSPRFVVLVDFSPSAGNARVLMDGRTRFTGHNFFYNGQRWGGSSFGRQIRAWVTWLAAPDIIAVRDVPNDQGRQAHVVWFPSPNEGFSDEISHYVLWRAVKGSGAAESNPSYRKITVQSMEELYNHGIKSGKSGDRVVVANGGAWDYITSVPSHPGFDAYGYVAPTLADSNASGRNYSTFMVSAYDVFDRFVDSQVDSGYSVDNIAPAAPANFTASNPVTGVQLSWKANEEEDLGYYAIYKGTDTTPLATTTALNYVDNNVNEGVTYDYRITAFDVNGNESESAAASVVVGVADRPKDAIPTDYALGNNYPNPFNPTTMITYQLPKAGEVKLTIINSLGQKVRTLVTGQVAAGYHQTLWDARDDNGALVGSGTYLYRLEAGNFVQTKKLVLMK